MTKPVTINQALIPACNKRWENENKEKEEKKVWGYAPPGASIRAKLRTLPLDESEETALLDEAEKTNGNGHRVVSVEKKGTGDINEITLKIDAVVTVIGKMPEEGVAVETITLLRPADKKANHD